MGLRALISAMSPQHVLALTGRFLSLLDDPAAVLLAYVTFYNQRGDGLETSFKGDKQGRSLTQKYQPITIKSQGHKLTFSC